MVGCNQKFFVVAKGSEFELIDAKDTDIRVLLDSRELCYYIRWVSDGVSCIRERMEEVHFAKVNPPKRLPNGQFKLLDYLGNEVHDGQIFNLVYDTLGYGLYSGMSDEEDDDFDDFVNNIYGEYRGLSVFNDSLTLYPKSEAEFTSETIDGIVYLKCGGKYVYCPLDGEEHIKLKSELPKKDERLHLECNGIEVYISRWNKCGYISEMVGHRGVLRFPPADAVDPLEDGSSFSLM
ncbi:hypothetical protein FBU59_001477 [Linderina macrospora]|uniref:Uncharacterized protein n=1 Tax=Linderina macrospora TaxID=4868 RepID=A0ACC1JDX3_9FUNG|nr:hypothetical protein FBU59_001477 [Linderina macrospora]